MYSYIPILNFLNYTLAPKPDLVIRSPLNILWTEMCTVSSKVYFQYGWFGGWNSKLYYLKRAKHNVEDQEFCFNSGMTSCPVFECLVSQQFFRISYFHAESCSERGDGNEAADLDGCDETTHLQANSETTWLVRWSMNSSTTVVLEARMYIWVKRFHSFTGWDSPPWNVK